MFNRRVLVSLILTVSGMVSVFNESQGASAPEVSNTIEPDFQGNQGTSLRSITGPSGSELLIGGNFKVDDKCNVDGVYDYLITKKPRFGKICYREETAKIRYSSVEGDCVGKEVYTRILYYFGDGSDFGSDDFEYSAGLPGQMGANVIVSITLQPRGWGPIARTVGDTKVLDYETVPKCASNP